MIIALLIAGIAFVLAGALGVFLGIPVKEFSFGNTLIVAGVIAGSTGLLILGLAAVLRELRKIAGLLDSNASAVAVPASVAAATPRSQPSESPGFTSNRDQPSPPAPDSATPPWLEETAARERGRNELLSGPVSAPPEEAPPLARQQRRNLMFSSSRKEGSGRAETRVTDLSAPDPRPTPPPFVPAAKPTESSPPPFEGTWPPSERGRNGEPPLPQRRAGRMPPGSTEPAAGASGTDRPAPGTREDNRPAVTVIKSGIVDGMAYSLYSDGSIEAQMPEGMMRFGSIDELRAHLDQRS
jgi:hypothetical protein